MNVLLPFLSLLSRICPTLGDHLPPHSWPPPSPSELPWLSSGSLSLSPWPLTQGRRPNVEPQLLAAFEVGPRWPEAGGRGEGPLLRGGPPTPPPSPLGLRRGAHQWQQQAGHGGEAHVGPAVASHSPIGAQAAAAAAAAESGRRGPGRSREEPGAAGWGAEVETGVMITARSPAGTSKPKGQSWSPSPENWEKIKAKRERGGGREGRVADGVLQLRDRKSLGEEKGGGGRRGRRAVTLWSSVRGAGVPDPAASCPQPTNPTPPDPTPRCSKPLPPHPVTRSFPREQQ